MTRRRSLSPSKRLAVFEKFAGRCHICGFAIQAGEAWDVSHPIPLALGGADDESNWQPAHRKCHRGTDSHTSEDQARISKAKRQKAKTVLGIRKPPRLKGKPFAKKERAQKIDFTQRRALYVREP